MTNLIDLSFFVSEISIPNTNQQPVADHLMLLITEVQEQLLRDLLGDDLYAQFEVGLNAGPIDQKWIDLKNKIVHNQKSMIAYRVYCKWIDQTVTQTAGLGENLQQSENGTRYTINAKFVNAWNKMIDEMADFYSFIRDNYQNYPGISYVTHRRFRKINLMGI